MVKLEAVISAPISAAPVSISRKPAPLIAARGLGRSYEGGRVAALSGVNLMLSDREFAAITGPSGSGKTTLLQLLGTLDQPEEGEVLWRGARIADTAHFRSREVGFVFQGFHLIPTLTALENVQVPMLGTGRSGAQQRGRALELLERVGLAHRAQHRPGAMSGGERQRVAIARALANGPRLLLADEPTGNLDSDNTHRIMELLDDLHAGGKLAVVVVTHDPQVAAYARRLISMRDGRIIGDTGEGAAP